MNLNYESLVSNYNFERLKESNIGTLNELTAL